MRCGIKSLRKTLPHKEILDMSHHNTLFSQMLSLIPRHVFQKLEHRHKVGRASRKFGFKEQFTAMAFIQLAARRSMRDGLRCLAAAGNRLYHWGLKNVARSTFADANNSRPVGLRLVRDKTSEAQISLQIQAVQLGRYHHQALPFALPMGFVPPSQRRRQNAHPAGP